MASPINPGPVDPGPHYPAPAYPPPGYPGPGYGPPTGGPRIRRRFRRLGCLGSLLALVLLIVIVQVAIAPWAFHIGNTFTPGGRWTGVAQARIPGGGPVAVRLTIVVRELGRESCSRTGGGCDDFGGSVDICTPAGRYRFSNVGGKVSAWLSTDGRRMTVTFSHGNTTLTRYLSGTLQGRWHGRVYQATDGGYLARDFAPDGTARAQVTSADPSHATVLNLAPGDFDALCPAITATT